MDHRAERIGRNEALFREVNERLEELNETFSTITDTLVLVCECGDASCAEQISMSPGQYEQLRGDPAQFAVVSGHVAADVEDVVARHDGYDVVKKHEGSPARIAEATHTRS